MARRIPLENSCRSSAGDDLADGHDLTPTGNRSNEENEQAIQATEAVGNNALRGDDEFDDISDSIFCNINTRVPAGHDWSLGHDETLSSALNNYTKAFYENRWPILLQIKMERFYISSMKNSIDQKMLSQTCRDS